MAKTSIASIVPRALFYTDPRFWNIRLPSIVGERRYQEMRPQTDGELRDILIGPPIGGDAQTYGVTSKLLPEQINLNYNDEPIDWIPEMHPGFLDTRLPQPNAQMVIREDQSIEVGVYVNNTTAVSPLTPTLALRSNYENIRIKALDVKSEDDLIRKTKPGFITTQFSFAVGQNYASSVVQIEKDHLLFASGGVYTIEENYYCHVYSGKDREFVGLTSYLTPLFHVSVLNGGFLAGIPRSKWPGYYHVEKDDSFNVDLWREDASVAKVVNLAWWGRAWLSPIK